MLKPDSGGFVVGPSLDIRLSSHLSIGAEALYKPLAYSDPVTFQDGAVVGFARAVVITWQFPVLARYRFRLGRVKPFLEAGPSFRSAGNLNRANPSHLGFTAGLGVETQWRRLRIAPRVRYTRWAEPKWCDVCTRADQFEFLAGFAYGAESARKPLGRRIALGAVAGTNLSDDSAGDTYDMPGSDLRLRTSSVRSLAIGPLVELSLSSRISIEANAITRSRRSVTKPVGGKCPGLSMGPCEWSSSSGGMWEFPVLAKYRLAGGPVRPFLAAGPSFRLPKEIAGYWLSKYGAAAGAGVEVALWRRINISPTLRYTHWGPDRPRAGSGGNSGEYRNQVQLLLGISF